MTIELPAPEFAIGQSVRVVQSTNINTPHTGTICETIWHYKDHRYNYYLKVGSKRISKRYTAQDLEACQ